MPKLVILRGNSGSGKTTVSKILQEKFGRNTMLISHDMVRRQILHAKDVEALPLIMQLLKYGRQNSDITILEGILPVEVYMPLFELAVQEYGQDIFAFYYDLPFEETLRRHATKPNRADLGEEDMRRWWNEKDFIHIIPEKTITKDFSISDTIDMIYDLVSFPKLLKRGVSYESKYWNGDPATASSAQGRAGRTGGNIGCIRAGSE